MYDGQFQTHEMWCEWWINDEYEVCDCGYREDLYIPEEWEKTSDKEGGLLKEE